MHDPKNDVMVSHRPYLNVCYAQFHLNYYFTLSFVANVLDTGYGLTTDLKSPVAEW